MPFIIKYKTPNGNTEHHGYYDTKPEAERELVRLKKRYPTWKLELKRVYSTSHHTEHSYWSGPARYVAIVVAFLLVLIIASEFLIPAVLSGSLSGCIDRLGRYGYIVLGQGGEVNVRFIDETGASYGIREIDNKPRFSASPYLYDIAEGIVPDHLAIRKFGFNSAVGATEETIWEQSSLYTYLAGAATLTISSDDNDDDGAPVGNGARTVQIYGLDTNYDEINEVVTLDGQNPVNTGTQYLRIYRMIVRSVGTTGSNEGTVYTGTGLVVGGVPANVYASMTPGMNQTLMAIFTIPRDHTGYLVDIYSSSAIANKATQVFLYIRPFGEGFQVKQTYHINQWGIAREFPIPLPIEARSDIEIRALAAGGGGAVAANFDVWYEK